VSGDAAGRREQLESEVATKAPFPSCTSSAHAMRAATISRGSKLSGSPTIVRSRFGDTSSAADDVGRPRRSWWNGTDVGHGDGMGRHHLGRIAHRTLGGCFHQGVTPRRGGRDLPRGGPLPVAYAAIVHSLLRDIYANSSQPGACSPWSRKVPTRGGRHPRAVNAGRTA
jgi:hypothetical protein